MGEAGEGAEVVDGYELTGAFADELSDLTMNASGCFVAITHDALDVFGGKYYYIFLHNPDRALIGL